MATYDGYTVVVDVCALMELLLDLGVFDLGPGEESRALVCV